ncbi:MAG: BrnT family toxin [Gammaproteobacteria bacterium]
MVIGWDEWKRRTNLKKHGFDFVDAEEVFTGVTFTYEDDRFSYGEQRLVTLGLLRGVVVSIVHTERGDRIQIISMRKATKREREIYFKTISN